MSGNLTPKEAIDGLCTLHADAVAALRASLERYIQTRQPPTGHERAAARYPSLTVTYAPAGPPPTISTS